jgi:hypothetical protein
MIYYGRNVRLIKMDEHNLVGRGIGAISRHRRALGPSLSGITPRPPIYLPPLLIGGNTLTGAGAALGGCSVELYRVIDDARVDATTSDGAGVFNFSPVSPGLLYYAVAYLSGSPDRAGTTRNILAGNASVSIYLRDPTAPDSGGSNTYSRSRVANA